MIAFKVHRASHEPTDAQIKAGNYPKRKVAWNGLTLAIENEAGSVRRGTKPDGTPWQTRMLFPYGYVLGSEGVDGDHVDVFLGPDEAAPLVYVVHQRKVGDWDQYDEDKAMVGFSSEDDARAAFLACYDDPRFLGPITVMPVAEFVGKVKATADKPAMIKSAPIVVFMKSYVPSHTRRLHDGRVIQVDAYSDRRIKKVDPNQMILFREPAPATAPAVAAAPATVEPAEGKASGGPDLASYDKIIVAFSGGKDSIAALLDLIDRGVPRDKIELHHHDIDGGGETFMDWPITPAYCRAVADALGLPIYFSYREGGFKREMLRDNSETAPVVFEKPDGTLGRAGGHSGKLGTRQKFPQVSADLKTRWCSGALKVDVMAAAIRNQERFDHKRTLVVTGERAEESSNRAKYKTFEPHRTHTQSRHVDHYRPVHGWSEKDAWDIMQRHGIVPHPAYQLGWSRLSCRNCIFGSANQQATNRKLFPEGFEEIAGYEKKFGTTIHRTSSVHERADKGAPYEAAVSRPELARLADSRVWSGPIVIPPEEWKMPAGAFGEKGGPT